MKEELAVSRQHGERLDWRLKKAESPCESWQTREREKFDQKKVVGILTRHRNPERAGIQVRQFQCVDNSHTGHLCI